MGLRSKVVLPATAYALGLLGLVAWAGWPGLARDAPRAPMLLSLAASLALLLIIVVVSLDRYVRRPLAALVRANAAPSPPLLAPSAPVPDEIGRIVAGLRALHEKIAQQQAELRGVAERREHVEQALKLSEERFALAVRGANDGLWERDLDRDQLMLSPRWKGMLGYSEEEFPDRLDAWRAHVHPQDVSGVEAALDAHLQGATPRFEAQFRLLHKDGRFRWVLSRGNAMRHANGRAYRIVGLDTDVSAIKRVEHVLAQVVEGTAGVYGDDFFRSLVRHFAAALEVPCAFITECADQPPTRVRTLAYWSDSRFLDSVEYELPGTPCETVIREGRICFHPTGLAGAFPVEAGFQSYLGVPIFGRDRKVLGHLAFLDQKEMGREVLVDAVFRIFAARAAAELERKAILERLAPAQVRQVT